MPVEPREPIELHRNFARPAGVASVFMAAMLWVSAERADAMGFRGGFGGFHVGSGTSRGPAYSVPAGDSRANLVSSRRFGSRRVRLPSGGDRPPRHPHRPHRPIVVGLPPSGPTGIA